MGKYRKNGLNPGEYTFFIYEIQRKRNKVVLILPLVLVDKTIIVKMYKKLKRMV